MKEAIWQSHSITRADQMRLNQHRSFCLWFTGLSGSGKSTLANAVQQALHQRGIRTYMLDGDNVRHGLNRDLGFTRADREENVRRVAEVAALFVDAGVISIAALISPFERDRARARNTFQNGDFIEVFVDCPIEKCMERDPKGLYKKVHQGLMHDFTGIDSPYERPSNPEIVVHTDHYPVEDNVDQIMRYLEDRLIHERLTL